MKRETRVVERLAAYLLCAVMLVTSIPSFVYAQDDSVSVAEATAIQQEKDSGQITEPAAEEMKDNEGKSEDDTDISNDDIEVSEDENPDIQDDPEDEGDYEDPDIQEPVEDSEDTFETEEGVDEVPETTLTVSPEPTPTEEPKDREPIDWTNHMDVLGLQVSGFTYKDQNHEESVTVNAENGSLDLSCLLEEKIEELKLNYTFTVKNTEDSKVQSKDYFTVAFPYEYFSTEAVEKQEIRDSLTEAVIGTWRTTDAGVKVTLGAEADREDFIQATGNIQIPVAFRDEILEEEPMTKELLLQQDEKGNTAKIAFVFPAMPKEEIQDPESQDTEAPTPTPNPEKKHKKKSQKKKANPVVDEESVEAAQLFTAEEKSGETPVPSEFKEQEFSKLWLDDNIIQRQFIAENNIEVTFSVGGEKDLPYDKDHAQKYLGQMSLSTFEKKNNTGTYDVYTLSVPTKVTTKDSAGKETSQAVTWNLTENWKNDNYLQPESRGDDNANGLKNLWINRKDSGFNFKLNILQGALNANALSIANAENYIKLFRKSVKGEENDVCLGYLDGRDWYPKGVGLPENFAAPECVTGSDGVTVTVKGLPLFSEDDEEYIYYVKADSAAIHSGNLDFSDYYEPSYKNEDSGNFGSVIDRCHKEGTLNLTLKGTTTYHAYKIWLDDKSVETIAARPEAVVYLWRFTDKKVGGEESSYKQAAQVKDKNSSNLFLKLSNESNSKFEFNNLEKYDPEGYKYVYLTRESLAGSDYEQVFLSESTPNIKSLSVEDIENTTITDITEDTNHADDKSIYNDEILANRITGNTNVFWKKIWKASNYQNDLGDVSVELTLYAKNAEDTVVKEEKADSSGDSWTPTKTKITISGFFAEQLIKSGSETVNLYNKMGIKQDYQWQESAIYEKDDKSPVNLENGKFQLSHNKNNPDFSKNGDDNEYYVSDIEQTVTDEGYPYTIITNTLQGTTSYTVDKLWASDSVDENGNTIYGKDAPGDASVTVQLYQDENSSFEYDGNRKITLNEKPWYYKFDNLPKYDNNGKKFQYIAKETAHMPSDWHVDVEYDVSGSDGDGEPYYYDCQLKNSPVGKGKTIKIRKQWLDDGDEAHREKVIVAVYRKALEDEESDYYFGTCELEKNKGWWAEYDVSEWSDETHSDLVNENVPLDGYYIREVQIGSNATFTYDGTNGPYKNESAEQYSPAKGGGAPVYGTDGGAKDTIDIAMASHHKYQITYGIDSAAGELLVTNRRIGLVNVTVTKKWLDGNDEDHNRGEQVINNGIKLTLSPNGDDGYSDKSVKINRTDAGDTVTVIGTIDENNRNTLSILDSSGSQISAEQNVDDTDNEKYYFHHLPKYDAEGKVIHYQVKEEGVKDPYKVYYEELYTQDPAENEFVNDIQEITVKNKREGVKTIKFNKVWLDAYVYNQGKRPDIYLTLYTVFLNYLTKTLILRHI